MNEIKLQPEILKKLREASGYQIEEVAKKLKTSKDKIESVEAGKGHFTLTQIKKLAEIYKRPLAAFFSDSIVELPKITDFRINRDKRIPPSVYLAERRLQYLLDKTKELSGKKSKIPSFPVELRPVELAKVFREILNIDIVKNRKSDEILQYYKKVLEDTFSIVIIEYPLKTEDANDVRGFSICSDLSGLVLNENDKSSIKIFSLFHEICHLIRNTSGICSIIDIEEKKQDEEFYCNEFAAEFLVPSEDLKSEIEKYNLNDEKAINQITEIYGVSKQVMMLCLLKFGYIKKDKYEEFKKKVEEGIKQNKFSRKNWEKVFLNRVGNLSLQEVRTAYNKQSITFYEASSILGLKTKYADKLLTH